MNYYDLCCQHKGKIVQIKEKCGNVHIGRIAHVDQENVWLERTNTGSGFGYGHGGHGYYGQYGYSGYHGQGSYYKHGGYPGYGRPSYGTGYGTGVTGNPYFFPVALAGIGGFALGSAFFW